jgi:hypothetical protein
LTPVLLYVFELPLVSWVAQLLFLRFNCHITSALALMAVMLMLLRYQPVSPSVPTVM